MTIEKDMPINRIKKMKVNLKILILVSGILVAVSAIASTDLYAKPTEKNDISELKMMQTEMFELLEDVLENTPVIHNDDKCMKFYNSKKQLVYECRDKDDQRVKILLRRSDLLLKTNTSSYYLLD